MKRIKKILALLAISLMVLACADEKSKTAVNFTLTGSVKGLKKGTLYLKKIKDSTFITLDSITLYDTPEFTLETLLTEPEILYLYLDKNDHAKYDDLVSFFAEPKGTAAIKTKLQEFKESAQISGGENQKKLNEYRKVKKRFDIENLKLMKVNYEAQKQKDFLKIQEIEKSFKKNALRRYLYTVNFCMNNKDLAIAPYLVLSEIPDANLKYLDTVAGALTTTVRNSIYGKRLLQHIAQQKNQ